MSIVIFRDLSYLSLCLKTIEPFLVIYVMLFMVWIGSFIGSSSKVIKSLFSLVKCMDVPESRIQYGTASFDFLYFLL